MHREIRAMKCLRKTIFAAMIYDQQFERIDISASAVFVSGTQLALPLESTWPGHLLCEIDFLKILRDPNFPVQ